MLGLRSLVLVGQAGPEQVDGLVFLLPVLAAMTGPWEEGWFEVRDEGFATPCWMWLRSIAPNGYAKRNRKRYSSTLAHRQFYEDVKGAIPEGLDLDHLCRNRSCVNPEHLEPVPRHINAWRGAWTKLTPEQVREIRASELGDKALAEIYGVAAGAIWSARTGAQWRHVA